MKIKNLLMAVTTVTVATTAHAQLSIAPEFGTFSTAPGTIVFTNNSGAGDLVVLDVDADTGSMLTGVAKEDVGTIGYLGGNDWLFGMTSDASDGAGDVFIFNSEAATIGNPITNLNDVRDLAVVEQNGQLNAFVADRANDTMHLITDVLGSPSTSDITPDSIAGNVGIQGLVALNESLYFLYDELPDDGFGSDELIVVEGNTTEAATTRISWNEIGSSGAGLGTDELSVDFHNGLAVHQPDESTIVMYLSNFGTFSDSQVIEVVWEDTGNGFDFSAPTSSVLITEGDMFNAITANNGPIPADFVNARGVAILPGETAAEDQLVIWADDSGNSDTYMLIYDIASESFRTFGNDPLESVLESTNIDDWPIR